MFRGIGAQIGRDVVKTMEASGELHEIVAQAWERVAAKPENAHCAERLRAVAREIRKEAIRCQKKP